MALGTPVLKPLFLRVQISPNQDPLRWNFSSGRLQLSMGHLIHPLLILQGSGFLWKTNSDFLFVFMASYVQENRVLEKRKTTESKVCFNSSTLLTPSGIGVITKTYISEEQTSKLQVQENLHIGCHGIWEACHPFPTNVLLKTAESTQLCNTSHDRPSSSEPPTFIQRAPTRPWASIWRNITSAMTCFVGLTFYLIYCKTIVVKTGYYQNEWVTENIHAMQTLVKD